MENKKLNLYEKLIEIRKQVLYIKKEETVSAGKKNFNYTKGSILISLLRPKMDELGILLTYEITELIHKDISRVNYYKEIIPVGITQAKCVFTFINAETPSETIERVIWTTIKGEDIQDMGAIQTYMLRYFLLGFFNISNDKTDPDNHEKTVERLAQKEAENNYTKKEDMLKNKVDDGNSQVKSSYIDAQQVGCIKKMLDYLNNDSEKALLKSYNIENLEQIEKDNYERTIKALNRRVELKKEAANKK